MLSRINVMEIARIGAYVAPDCHSRIKLYLKIQWFDETKSLIRECDLYLYY